jgi:DNA-binding IscR family transcriptional regulator
MIATRFAVAIHVLMLVSSAGRGATSQAIASSVNTNPVVVRRIIAQLARAGLVRVRRGPGGAELRRLAAEITLRDVWLAVRAQPERPLFPVHGHPDPHCIVGGCIQRVLGGVFAEAEVALEQAFAQVTLERLLRGLEQGRDWKEAAGAQDGGAA